MDMQIYFPHLGIYLEHVGKNFSIFGFTIAYYGVVIVIGMLIAMALIMYTAKRFGENPDMYYDGRYPDSGCGIWPDHGPLGQFL